MMNNKKHFILLMTSFLFIAVSMAQNEKVSITKEDGEKKINVFIGQKLFTSFLYPDTLEKPVLYPIYTSKGTSVDKLPYSNFNEIYTVNSTFYADYQSVSLLGQTIRTF